MRPVYPPAIVDALAAYFRDGTARPVETSIIVGARSIVDLVAVTVVVGGQARLELTLAERRLAVLVGTKAGLGARVLAARLGIEQRSVVRHRQILGITAAATRQEEAV